MVAGSLKNDSRTPILFVAAVFLLGTLSPVVGTAHAATSGSMGIAVGPFFDASNSATFPSCPGSPNSPYVKAQPDGAIWQTRQIQVTGGSSTLKQVVFEYTIAASPGTATKPGLPQLIEWGDSAHGSSAAGWTVSVNNAPNSAGGVRTLTFNGGTLSPGPPGQVFTVAFRVRIDAVGDTAATLGAGTVNVTAGSKDVVGLGTSFIGFFAAGDTFKVSGDAHPYKVAAVADGTHLTLADALVGSSVSPSNGLAYVKQQPGTPAAQMSFPVDVEGFTGSGQQDAASTLPAFCVIVDNTPPKILSAITRDTNYNGLIDEIVLQFSEEMDPTTLDPRAFLVDASGSGEPIPYSILPVDQSRSLTSGLGSDDGNKQCLPPSPAPATCINLERTLRLTLAEGYHFDTGIVPQILYPNPTSHAPANFRDIAGNPLANVTATDVTEVDGAKPVLVSTFDFDGATNIVATFSEPVYGSGTGTQLNQVLTSDFYYFDGCYGWASPGGSPPPTCNPNSPTSSMGGTNCIEASGGISPEIGSAQHTPGTNGNTVILPIVQVPSSPGCTVVGHSGPVKGYVGAGDSHPTLGDVLSLNTMTSTPASCPGLDWMPCDALVQDMTGLRAVPTNCIQPANSCDGAFLTPALRGTITSSPAVKDATINIDTFQVTLTFNGPVSDASGDGNAITLADLYVIAADGSGQGPGGITQILHRAGSNLAILTLDKKARPTDVDDTPARIGIRCNTIKGTRLPAFVPCADPDAIGGPGVDLVDRVPPAILHAQTVDMNRDGNVDGVFLEFNEPVDDATFCQTGNQMPPLVCYPAPPISTGMLTIYPYTSASSVYTFDTFASPARLGENSPHFGDGNGAANDRYGIIRISNPVPQGTGQSASTGIVTTGPGLFSDLSHPGPPATPVYAVANHMGKICAANSGQGSCGSTVTLEDGAPPVLLSAKTVDTKAGILGTTQYDVEGNGVLDGYRLVFSEPINDKSFCHNNAQSGPVYLCNTIEWAVEGHKVIGMRTADPGDNDPKRANDSEVTVLFTEGNHADTGERPKLTYVGPESVTHGLQDLAGIQMLPLKPIDGFEQDDAPPVLVQAEGFLGRSNLTVKFSEPVDNGNKGVLTRTALQYFNVDHLSDGVSGMADQNGVEQAIRSDTLLVRLNCPIPTPPALTCGNIGLQKHDIENDTIAAELNSVWEVSPTVGTVIIHGSATSDAGKPTCLGAPPYPPTCDPPGTTYNTITDGALLDKTVVGYRLVISSGPAAGTYTVTGVSGATLTYTPSSSAYAQTANAYTLQAQKKAASTKGHHLGNAIDVFRPNNVTQLQMVSPLSTANSLTVSWVAPGNDGAGFGPVMGYRIKVSTQKIGPVDFNASAAPGTVGLGDSDINATVRTDGTFNIVRLKGNSIYAILSPDAGGLAAPGKIQTVTIIGLDPETSYHVAVEAFDGATLPCGYKRTGELTYTAPLAPCSAAADTGRVDFRHYSGMRPLDVALAASNYDVSGTTGKDSTPPSPPPVIASTTHPANKAVRSRDAIFSWTNSTDAESRVTYHFAYNNQPQYQVLATDQIYSGSAPSPSVAIKVTGSGTWYFHVAAFSAPTLSTATAHYTFIVGETTIDPADIQLANTQVNLTAVRNGADNTVTWTLPDECCLPPGAQFQGVQIWRLDNCDGKTACKPVLVKQINGTYSQLATGNYVDNSTAAGTGSAYRVDMVFKDDQTQPQSIEGFTLVQSTASSNNAWLWWLIGGLALLVIAGIVIAVIVARRKRAAAAASFEEIPQENIAAGMDPATGMPTHDVRCPSCQTAFQAVGSLPLQITCPNCGVSGLLQ